MDRPTVYAGATPRETDILDVGQFAMTGLALLAQDLIGTTTQVFGASCGPTTPSASLAVVIQPGRIYQMASLEPSIWSSLPANSTQVMKQGNNFLTQTFNTPAPGTVGQSINYLIEAQYQENDGNPLTLSYYNASNPQQPFSGPNNSSIAQNTIRFGQFICQIKAGTAATTGSQTTPAPDSGWVGLYVVTVVQGQSTVTSGNISVYSSAPFAGPQSGTFIMTGTGFSTGPPTATCYYRVINGMATVAIGTGLTGTSNSGAFTGTGMPTFLQPHPIFGGGGPDIQLPCVNAVNNGVAVNGAFATFVPGSSTILFGVNNNVNGWTGSGNKSVSGSFTYPLAIPG